VISSQGSPDGGATARPPSGSLTEDGDVHGQIVERAERILVRPTLHPTSLRTAASIAQSPRVRVLPISPSTGRDSNENKRRAGSMVARSTAARV
jgi:hypothetical protein